MQRRIKEIGDVEARIIDAAHEAEDVIESVVVTQIQKQHAKRHAPRSDHHQIVLEALHGGIAKVMNIFNSIVEDFPDMRVMEDISRQPENKSTTSISSKDIMVGFDEHLNQIKSGLASNDSSLVVIPIVGMGGMGKTTLAKNVSKDPLIIELFDRFAWVRVSQEYQERDIVRALLLQINSTIIDPGKELSGDELGVLLHKELFARRYLIVLDDVWDIEAWDYLKRYLPGNNNGSRILVTTRLFNLAQVLGPGSSPHQMTLLDEEKSWDLIHEYVKEDCPNELEEIGRSIARGCGGLPLALVAIGGILTKSEKTMDFWKNVESNVTSIANYTDGDEKCIEILRMSYSELPVHLKPCFLYLAAFPKHSEIRVSRLIRLWVAEGFIKPSEDKILEKVAGEYLKDLLDRNLVMTSKLGHDGKVIKKCSIHDLMRDLCTNEAEKNKFIWFDHTNAGMENERRLCIHTSGSGKQLRPSLHNRSLLSSSAWESRRKVARGPNLVRVLDVVDSYSVEEISWLTNSRYITCTIPRDLNVPCFVFVSLLWNLQTLALSEPIVLPSGFWQMSQLRHVNIPGITQSDPGDDDEFVVLENLQTLATVRDFTFSQNVVKRIRNVNKLGIDCEASFGLKNVASLDKLESLVLKCRGSWENMGFPKSLRKLKLSYCQIPWEEMSVVGSLPNLEALKLQKRAAIGRKWSPNENEFVRLKSLLIDWCQLEIWEAHSSHFPSLEQLQLVGVRVEEFPVDFAEIETLRAINLNYCNEALLLSAQSMSEIREDYGYEDIQIRAFPSGASRSRKRNLVGLEDEVEKLKGYLLEESEELDVISIVGMGGLGKTTLAREIFHDPEIQYEFPTRIWHTVSQEFSGRSVLIYILKEFTALTDDICDKTDGELAHLVVEFLCFSKFLVVFDDLWTEDVWRYLQYALPRTGKVLITTRDRSVCHSVNSCRVIHMLRLLSPEESWLLLCLEVFGKPEFPSKLKGEAKRIVYHCRGHPLTVVLIGGILLKKLAESNEESALAAALDEVSRSFFSAGFSFESIIQVVTLSYEKLPHHLRKCFLYVGMFPEDYEIPTWKLIRLWIAEGFVQEEDNISLEETAEKYLDDLISSNLLRADKLNGNGKVKTIGIHDLLRDLCIFKAVEEEGGIFFKYIHMSYSDVSMEVSEEKKYQRLCIHSNVLRFLFRKPYCPSVSSFLCFSKEDYVVDQPEYTSAIAAGFKALRVLDIMPLRIAPLLKPALGKGIVRKIKKKVGWGRGASALPMDPQFYKLLHLRYLALSLDSPLLPADFSKFRNIQTLIVHTTSPTLDVQADILNMIELRHFKTNASATLPNPTAYCEGGDSIQTLGMISPESCTEQILGRARNLKKLGIRGKLALLLEDRNNSFHSLAKLEDLEKLKLMNDDDVYPLLTLPPAEKFPMKLRILTLCRTALDWSYTSVLGSLENLEVLKLKGKAFQGKLWETTDGGFPHLLFLHIESTDLEMWVASQDHFPRLKHLVLRYCEGLQELPLGLAHVPNFQRLELHRCSRAAASSAKMISEAKKRQEDQQQSTNVRSFSLNVSR